MDLTSSAIEAKLRACAQKAGETLATPKTAAGAGATPTSSSEAALAVLHIERPAPRDPGLPLTLNEGSSQSFGGAHLLPSASRAATVGDAALSALERIHKDMLTAITANLKPKEIVPLAASSHALQQKLGSEIADRRVRAMLPAWEAKVTASINQVVNLARSHKERHELTLLAHYLYGLGQHAKAAQALRLLDWGGNNDNTHLELAQILITANQPDAAIEAATKLLAREATDEEPTEVEPRIIIAQALLLLNRPQDARGELNHVAGVNSVKLAMVRAMVAHSLGESPQPALDIAINGFVNSPYWASQRSRMAEVYAWLGDASKALSWMEKATAAPLDEHLARIPLSPFAMAIRDDPHWKPLRLLAEQINGTTDIPLPWPPRRR